tara:strand:+ start:1547 stop:2101 length:555 start_codon:yes stop_codon:yes gene_type:complete
MKKIVTFFGFILIISCSKDIETEKIGKEYFGDYSYTIDTIGETENYLLKSYEINVWTAHTEYFKGISFKNENSVIYKLNVSSDLSPQIINDSLGLVNGDFHLTRNNGCWINKYKYDSYKPLYNENNERINPFGVDTSNLKRGIYFLKNGKLYLVQDIDEIGFYYLTKHSRGIEKMISIDELIKQ